jgi:vacuolar-type H+-ATPase subunit F/Vma7
MRLIVLGSDELTAGFALLGFEPVSDPTPADVESLLGELVRSGEKALLFVEHPVAQAAASALAPVRNRGGGILVSELPPLNDPGAFHPQVEDLVARVLGPGALREQP